MPRFFDEQQYAVVQAACARLIPTDDEPGATEAGVVDYIDGFLGAFASDPPLIWAGWTVLGTVRRQRLGSQRSTDSPRVTSSPGALGSKARSASANASGSDRSSACRSSIDKGSWRSARSSCDLSGEEQDQRLRENGEFTTLLYEHACEGMYGAPEYLGNRGLVGWNNIGWAGDVQPRGYTDEEVSQP